MSTRSIETKDFKRVLIVGGGLAGLGLAGFLYEQGVEPVVVEKAEEWRRVGYGIGLWQDGIQVLERLGVIDVATEVGTRPTELQARGTDGDLLANARFGDPDTVPFVAIHRADLHAALRESVPAEWIRMGTTPTSIDERPDEVLVTFDDGGREAFDLVVGTDGIGSTVREQCFTDWSVNDCGTVAWSFWAPPEIEFPDATVSVWASGTEAFLTRVSGQGLVNVATTLPAERSAPPTRAQLKRTADRLGWLLPDLVNGLDPDADLFFHRNRRVSADRWVTNRVCLIGDAAHAIHPISGMGASLALEDAAVLAQEIATTTEEGLPTSLERYVARRRNPVRRAQREARIEAAITFTESDMLVRLRGLLVEKTPLFEWFVRNQSAVF